MPSPSACASARNPVCARRAGMPDASWSPRRRGQVLSGRGPDTGCCWLRRGWYRGWFHHHGRPAGSPHATAHTNTHINRPTARNSLSQAAAAAGCQRCRSSVWPRWPCWRGGCGDRDLRKLWAWILLVPGRWLRAGLEGASGGGRAVWTGVRGVAAAAADRGPLTQEELAEAAGLSPRSVSDLERGIHRTAHKDTAALLAGALGLAEPARALFVAAARGRVPAAEALAAVRGDSPGAAAAAATRALPRDTANLPAASGNWRGCWRS
jgi:transcriptional regulator with XRE-family HTH domain